MKLKNNIISRIKSLFRREPQTQAETQSTAPAIAESTTGAHGSKAHKSVDPSELSDSRCRAFFTDLCAHLTQELHIQEESISLHDYSNGAALISTDPNFVLGLVLLNTSGGQKNLPDNTALMMHLGSALYGEPFIAAFDKFRLHLLRLCRKHRVQHLAYDFAPPRLELPTTVPADCLCHRLYES